MIHLLTCSTITLVHKTSYHSLSYAKSQIRVLLYNARVEVTMIECWHLHVNIQLLWMCCYRTVSPPSQLRSVSGGRLSCPVCSVFSSSTSDSWARRTCTLSCERRLLCRICNRMPTVNKIDKISVLSCL